MLECSHCACSNFTLVKMEFRYKQFVLPLLVGCYHIPEIPQAVEGCAECSHLAGVRIEMSSQDPLWMAETRGEFACVCASNVVSS